MRSGWFGRGGMGGGDAPTSSVDGTALDTSIGRKPATDISYNSQ